MYRLHPMWVETKRMVDEGAIGELVAVDSVFSYFNDDPTNIRNIAETGGGALYDIGCYAINSARLLFGSEPTDVIASIRRDATSGVDTVVSAVLGFGEGVASFTCGTRMEPDQRVTAYGTEGRIVVEIPFNIPLDRPTRIFEVRGRRPPEDLDVTVHEFQATNQYTVEAEAFSRAIQTGQPAPIPPGDAVANMEVIDRVFAAAS